MNIEYIVSEYGYQRAEEKISLQSGARGFWKRRM